MVSVSGEPRLLLREDLGGARFSLHELRVVVPHFSHQCGHELVEKRLGLSELVPMPDRPPDDAAQHVAAALVGRNHPVDNEKGACANVISDHPQTRRIEVPRAGNLRRLADQRLEEVDIVIAVHSLHHGRNTLETHAGVDRGLGERHETPSADRSYCMKTRFQIST